MSLSEEYLARLHALAAEINEAHARLSRAMSDADLAVSNIYHAIERTEFDEASALSAIMLLQNALHRRRLVKDEMARLQPIRTMLTANIPEMERRHRKAARMSAEIRSAIKFKEESSYANHSNL